MIRLEKLGKIVFTIFLLIFRKVIFLLICFQVVEEKMNWGVVLIVGGGFALAEGMSK